MSSSKILLEKDLLPPLIADKALFPVERWAEKSVGRGEGTHGTNEILWEIHKEIDEVRWLKEMTVYLFCRTERIRAVTKMSGATISEFAYIPTPGLKNGIRIHHPCETRSRLKMRSILTEAPNSRSRELAWLIPYRTSVRETNLIFILTFDPTMEVMVRTINKEWDACTAYWRAAAGAQGLLANEVQNTCLHAFTGLHEWMEIIQTEDGDETPQFWKRHGVSDDETAHAANAGLDIYYSNSVLAYAWSTLEKQKGRERARANLQQSLCKKVILFDPIFGRNQGTKVKQDLVAPDFLDAGESETEKTAKGFWEGTAGAAHEKGASDIHIEPIQVAGRKGCDLIVSLRKDGQLNFHTRIPGEIAPDFVRFALETSGIIREENRVPQDGRRGWINPHTGQALDMRISVTPVGAPLQKIVMRLLDTNKLKHGIPDLGLEPEEIQIWEKSLKLNQSLVLVSGPTNSGKTLRGDTAIKTSNGTTRLATLVARVSAREKIHVDTLQGPCVITKGYACGEKPEWKLKTTKATVFGAATHPFLRHGGTEWTELGNLRAGMKLVGPGGEAEEILEVRPTGKSKEMFDIEVADAHHYFAEGLVAHNSTTLYAALLTIFERDNRRSFATIEDPVEYRLPFRSTQSPVNDEKGATYERLIRQAMRNDGDTFLIGEIRDGPTASAAIQLALTGHQVLSSIHANSATETALRLLELGVDPHLLSETLRLIVAQRLVPTPCPLCTREIGSTDIKSVLRKHGGEIRLETCGPKWERKYRKDARWVEGDGCPSCSFTGVSGMMAAQEFLVLDAKNKKSLKDGNMDALTASMVERSLPTIEETVWRLAWLGKIPVSQAGELTDQLKNY